MDALPQVLVVDDYRDALELASVVLACAGYSVLLADNVAHALALAKRHHPVAIVMDIFMPMMDGIAAARLLRVDPELTDIAIVAHTARAAGLHGIEDLSMGSARSPALLRPFWRQCGARSRLGRVCLTTKAPGAQTTEQ